MEDLLTVRDAARLAGVSEVTFWRWIKAGRLTPVQRGGKGRKYYLRSQVLAAATVTGGNAPGGGPKPKRRRRPTVTRGNTERVAAAHQQLDLVELARKPGISAATIINLVEVLGPRLRLEVPRTTLTNGDCLPTAA